MQPSEESPFPPGLIAELRGRPYGSNLSHWWDYRCGWTATSLPVPVLPLLDIPNGIYVSEGPKLPASIDADGHGHGSYPESPTLASDLWVRHYSRSHVRRLQPLHAVIALLAALSVF